MSMQTAKVMCIATLIRAGSKKPIRVGISKVTTSNKKQPIVITKNLIVTKKTEIKEIKECSNDKESQAWEAVDADKC